MLRPSAPRLALVHSDQRGELFSITLLGDRELMLLFSKAGSLRGGHAHDVPEAVMLLEGRMRYHKLDVTGKEQTEELTAGDASSNPAGQVHMGEFLEDTWLIEWKIGTTAKGWRNINYEPWRAKVRASA